MERSRQGNNRPCQLVLMLALSVGMATAAAQLRQLGYLHVPHAGFASVVEKDNIHDAASRSTLIVSAFNPIPFTQDIIYQVPEIGKHLNTLSTIHPQEVTRAVTWPNEITKVPDAVFHSPNYVIAAGGFLVPLKTKGSLSLFDIEREPPTQHVLTDSSAAQWFYHRVFWKDMNADGLLDIVTCRAKTHLIGGNEGQLVWFEHPKTNAMTQKWQPHVISNHGADFFFALTSLPTTNGVMDCVITSSFFGHSLNVFWSTDPHGRWDDASKIESRMIDNKIGAVFDVHVRDVNGDGKKDLLVTNNAAHGASIYAYTAPQDFRTGTFERKTLATGYASRSAGPGRGAPGSPLLVYPKTHHSSHEKPLILLSGDDDAQAHFLQPSSDAASDWSYQQTELLDLGRSTVGEIAVHDVDADGFNEVFIPSFGEGRVYVFTFKP